MSTQMKLSHTVLLFKVAYWLAKKARKNNSSSM